MEEVNEISGKIVQASMIAAGVIRLNKALTDRQCSKIFAQLSDMQSFAFSGTVADLSYFWNNKELSINAIKELQQIDVALYDNVRRTFMERATLGYINYKDGVYTLTNKGKKLISKPRYINEAKCYRNEALKHYEKLLANSKVTYGVLEGRISDLEIFKHIDTISYSDVVSSEKVASFFDGLQKKKFVYIDKSLDTIKLTKAGQEYINSESFMALSKGMNVTDNLLATSNVGKVFIALKRIFGTYQAVNTAQSLTVGSANSLSM